MADKYYIPQSVKRKLIENSNEAIYNANLPSLKETGQFGGNWSNPSYEINKIAKEGLINATDARKYLSEQVGAPGSVDESKLTDQELQDRLSNFQDLQSIQEPGHDVFNQSKFANDAADRIAEMLRGQNQPVPSRDRLVEAGNYLQNSIRNGTGVFNGIKGYDPQVLTEILKGGKVSAADDTVKNIAGSIYQEFFPKVNSYNQAVESGAYPNYSQDINRISDLVKGRQGIQNAQGQVDQLISGLPGELARGREQLFAGQADDASRFYSENLAPQIMAGLNSRGILYSGDLESELSRGAGDVQANLEQAQAQQIADDNQFFQNAAYQQTFQKEIQAGANLSGQVASERNTAMQTQGFNFQRTQADLSRRYNELINQRQNDAALSAARANAQRQQDLMSSQNNMNNLNALATGASAIASAYVGNKYGLGSSSGTTGTGSGTGNNTGTGTSGGNQ